MTSSSDPSVAASTRRRRAQRPDEPLSKERIVDVAIAIGKAEGADAVSMRRIATELGTGAMSLYNHVPDKDALVEAMADRVLGSVEVPPSGDPVLIAATWATTLRSTLLDHRALVPLLVAPNRLGPLLGVRAAFVGAMTSAGCDTRTATRAMQVLTRFVAGSVLIDAALLRHKVAARKDLEKIFVTGLDALLAGLLQSEPEPSAT